MDSFTFDRSTEHWQGCFSILTVTLNSFKHNVSCIVNKISSSHLIRQSHRIRKCIPPKVAKHNMTNKTGNHSIFFHSGSQSGKLARTSLNISTTASTNSPIPNFSNKSLISTSIESTANCFRVVDQFRAPRKHRSVGRWVPIPSSAIRWMRLALVSSSWRRR